MQDDMTHIMTELSNTSLYMIVALWHLLIVTVELFHISMDYNGTRTIFVDPSNICIFKVI